MPRLNRSAIALQSVLVLIVVWVAVSSRAVWPSVVATGVAWVLGGGRRWPLVGVTAAFAGLFVVSPTIKVDDPFLALLVIACFFGGRYSRPSRQPWAVAGVLVLVSVNVLQPGRGPDTAAVFPVLLTAGPWLLGLVVQLAVSREQQAVRRAALLEADQTMQILQATAEERLHIAREFHDIVAHDISALSLQAQLARRTVEAGGTVTGDALAQIETAAQDAMNDVRRLLGVLRSSDPASTSPAPGWDDVETLIAKERALGHAVTVTESGCRPRVLPPALSHAAYRVIQECLSNARRHGCGATRLTIEWRPQSLALAIANPAARAGPVRNGHGLAGIAERAAMFGGSIETAMAGGEWHVAVVLPCATLGT